jgi:hypothetical protein
MGSRHPGRQPGRQPGHASDRATLDEQARRSRPSIGKTVLSLGEAASARRSGPADVAARIAAEAPTFDGPMPPRVAAFVRRHLPLSKRDDG